MVFKILMKKQALSKENIKAHLKNDMDVFYYESTDSTNVRAKEYVKNGGEGYALFVASHQTNGKGRQGKSFYSPQNTGLYMTFLFSPHTQMQDTIFVTTKTAVAVVQAIEKLTDKKPLIKWVNDIYLDDKKICGILAESVANFKENTCHHVIIGIGVNLTTKSFPKEISDVAGSLDVKDLSPDILCALIADNLFEMTKDLADNSFMDYYRDRSCVIGREITYFENGVPHKAVATDIDRNGALLLENSKALTSGEITVRIKK